MIGDEQGNNAHHYQQNHHHNHQNNGPSAGQAGFNQQTPHGGQTQQEPSYGQGHDQGYNGGDQASNLQQYDQRQFSNQSQPNRFEGGQQRHAQGQERYNQGQDRFNDGQQRFNDGQQRFADGHQRFADGQQSSESGQQTHFDQQRASRSQAPQGINLDTAGRQDHQANPAQGFSSNSQTRSHNSGYQQPQQRQEESNRNSSNGSFNSSGTDSNSQHGSGNKDKTNTSAAGYASNTPSTTHGRTSTADNGRTVDGNTSNGFGPNPTLGRRYPNNDDVQRSDISRVPVGANEYSKQPIHSDTTEGIDSTNRYKPSIGDKLKAKTEKFMGKLDNDPERVAAADSKLQQRRT